jgi:hypothetical protein
LPIVCANIADLREMAIDEDMAVSFYEIGDAADLAAQMTTILQSSELQRRMAEHNYTAGVRMTMRCVVHNYLRWFELQRCKKAICREDEIASRKPRWGNVSTLADRTTDSNWPNPPGSRELDGSGPQRVPGSTEEADLTASFAKSSVWKLPGPTRGGPAVDQYPSSPTLETEC